MTRPVPTPASAGTTDLGELLTPIASWLAARDGYSFTAELGDREREQYLDEAGRLAEAAALPIATLRERAEAAEKALERDRSTVAVFVNKMRESLKGRSWLLEGGRGPYAWDDDRFRAEFSQALDEIAAPLDVLRDIARDWSNCPTDPEAIKDARTDWKPRLATLAAENEALRKVVKPFANCWRPHKAPLEFTTIQVRSTDLAAALRLDTELTYGGTHADQSL